MILFQGTPYPIAWFLYGIGFGLLTATGYIMIRRIRLPSTRQEIEDLQAELIKATENQVEAMRTLSAFRRQYHDGTGALVNEVRKLTREIQRLKTAVKEKGIK